MNKSFLLLFVLSSFFLAGCGHNKTNSIAENIVGVLAPKPLYRDPVFDGAAAIVSGCQDTTAGITLDQYDS